MERLHADEVTELEIRNPYTSPFPFKVYRTWGTDDEEFLAVSDDLNILIRDDGPDCDVEALIFEEVTFLIDEIKEDVGSEKDAVRAALDAMRKPR